MNNDTYKRQMDNLKQRKQRDKQNHQNKINYLHSQIQSENERYTKLMQYYTIEEERLKKAKQTSSNEEFIEFPNIRELLNKINILCEELL